MQIQKLLIFLVAIVLGTPVAANSTRIYELEADLWARPRSGSTIPQLQAIRNAVEYWQKGQNALILLSYPGEDSGVIWSSELHDWLVSLGVPSSAIVQRAGLGVDGRLRIIVGKREELE